MSTFFQRFLCLLLLFPACLVAQAAAAKASGDALNRGNPRASVTAFLEACQRGNYSLAAQYLDLRQLPEWERTERGPELARELEAILNSDSHFDVLRLSQSSDGNPTDSSNPTLETIATLPRAGGTFNLQLERVSLQTGGAEVWLFSPATVEAIPSLKPADTTSAIESRLPRFLVSIQFLDTAIWKWIALLIVVIVFVVLFQLVEKLTLAVISKFEVSSAFFARRIWIRSLLQPWLVLLAAILFGLAEQFVNPSAISRLYIGRALLLVVVWAFAWCLINIVDLFLTRLDTLLDPRQRMVSHSMIYMGKRGAKVAIFVVAMIIVLDNWGYNMTTMIAGLGVGGIAVALAAQATIANIFGGVSVIADHPVMVGDFGNFGGVMGTVEDIGLRSTRVRTLNRTVMSIPNSAFAGMNLENYAQRDKILFNPTLQIKRGTSTEKIRALIRAIETLLKEHKDVEIGPSPVRVTGLSATAIAMEIFAYTLTDDINEFYKVEADLFLSLDATLASVGVELV
jgi:MscS family membrane protein